MHKVSLIMSCFRRRLMPAVAVLILLLSSQALAQGTLYLKDVVREARDNNPEIQALRRNVEANEARARAEGILDDPFFRIEMMGLPTEDPLPIPGNAMQTKYGLSQMLPFPGKLSLRKEIALREVLMSKARLAEKELEIVEKVKNAYYDHLLTAGSLEIAEEVKGVVSNMIRIAEIKYATGKVSQQDVVKAQVELTMLINEIVTLEARKEVIEAELKALLNRPQDTPSLGESILTEKKITLEIDGLIRRALEINPLLRLMRYEVEANQLKVELAGKDYYPNFMVSVAPIQREGKFDAWDAMLEINIPIRRDKYDNRVDASVRMVEAFRYRLKAEENMTAAGVKEAAIRVNTADEIRILYETSLLPQTELSFDSALKNYQLGNVDFLTLLDNERVLFKTRLEHLDSVVTYYKRIASLERVVGEELLEE